MDRTHVEINIFISSSPQNTQEFKDTIATLNKVAESAGDVNNQKDIHMSMINLRTVLLPRRQVVCSSWEPLSMFWE
jgi:hypothetical protein